ncbi:MAG: Fic family protein [Nitrospirae bacterium]|nr:Fic family protein [Nitrospirota bacterium]
MGGCFDGTGDKSRIATLIFGKSSLRDRDEEEVRGYLNALKLVHEGGDMLSVSESTIRKLHKLSRGEIWDAGAYKEKDVDIIQTYPDGRSRVRFKPVSAGQTPQAMAEMIDLWNRGLRERWVHPLVLAAALNLDFLCIHPFRDGNGRVSRLLFLLTSYHCGLEAGRFVSLERLIEQNKARYYEVLEQSSQGWHEGEHDPWPTINFLLSILKQACKEFEQRVGHIKSPRGEKTAAVLAAIDRQIGDFRVTDLQADCPAVGVDLIRKLLSRLQQERKVCSLGTGRGAQWRKTGN